MLFIDTLTKKVVVTGMAGTHDYKRDVINATNNGMRGLLLLSTLSSQLLPCYLRLSINPSPTLRKGILKHWFARNKGVLRIETLPIVMGQLLIILRANDGWGIFGFGELCNRLLGTVDNIMIAYCNNQH